jgi:Sulfotransferase domain
VITLDHRNLVILPGMPRAGTTTLFAWLSRHPQIFAPWRKEPTYFSQNYERGEDWYRRFYADLKLGQVGIDASTEYFVSPVAADRMIAFDPRLRAVLIVRDPVDWAISLYARVRRVTGAGSFESFIHGFYYSRGGRGLRVEMGPGFVVRQIDRLRRSFQRNALLIDFRLMSTEPVAVLTAIESFIGISAHFAAAGVEEIQLNRRTEQAMGPVEWLMTREPMLGLLGSIVPSRVMMELRRRYERGMVATEMNKPSEAPGQRALAEAVFGADRQEVRRLFESAPIVLGDGTPFAPFSRSAPAAGLAEVLRP